MNIPKVQENLKPVHINCEKKCIADTVIMPGDPLRAKYIAENFLTDAELVNDTRNMFAYTGFYKNKRVTVMGSGMGMPSMSIYAFELFYFFEVKTIIRIGTCGSLSPNVKVGELLLATDSYNEGSFAYSYNGENIHLANSTSILNDKIMRVARNKKFKIHEGTVMTREQFDFYSDTEHVLKRVPKGIDLIGAEMESFALFHIANSFEREAACILTAVDSKFENTFMTVDERETSLNNMITLALDSIL
ncbi:MAG: purine-nucleoside phosphorylase [Firmicutes bacterium]|nr:purine-nucleoside phosphorylase [Bacillota bacterium]